RLTRLAASRSSTRARRFRLRTNGGHTDERANGRPYAGTQHNHAAQRKERIVTATGPTTTDPYAPQRETTEGRVFTVTGGDWDEVLGCSGDPIHDEPTAVTMGPHHPSTHA